MQPHSGAQANFAAFMARHQAGRDPHGDVAAARRPPVPRRVGQPQRHDLARGALRRRSGHRPDRLRRGARAGPARAAQAHHRRRQRLRADHRLRGVPLHRRRGRAPSSWWTWRTSRGWWPAGCIRRRCRTRRSSPAPRTRRCAARARGSSSAIAEHAKAIDKSVFPGTQGGPLEHVIAAKAVAFGEALTPEFRAYARQVVENAKTLADGAGRARLRHRLRRHRHPPDAGRPPAQGAHRQGGREDARSGRHHGQQEHDSGRPAVAVRDQRHPARHAGAHDPRHGHRRDGPRRRADRPRAHPRRTRPRSAGSGGGRGADLRLPAVRSRPSPPAACGAPPELRSRRPRERAAVRRRRPRAHPRAGRAATTSAAISSCSRRSSISSPGWTPGAT